MTTETTTAKRGGRRTGAGRPRAQDPKRTIGVRVKSSTLSALETEAARTGETVSELIRRCIAQQLGIRT